MSGGLARLLEIVLPDGGDVVVLLEGYFDESGGFDQEPKVFCIAGYFLYSEQAKEMDAAWGGVLKEHAIPYFHMVDCAHGNGVFAEKSKNERSEIVKKLIELIKAYTVEGFAAIVREETFVISEKHPDLYSACAQLCIGALQAYLEISRREGEIAYFFETGHKNRGRAYSHVAERLEKAGASMTFHKKEKLRLLQAADLLAWQVTKWAKDGITKKHPPRADFKSLMEHSHMIAHAGPDDGIGLEAFPKGLRHS